MDGRESDAQNLLAILHDWQRFYGMHPRPVAESRLTKLYLERKVGWPVEMIARELVATHFIYQTTLYGEVIEEFMREVAQYVKKTYKIPWGDVWRIVRIYAPPALKLIMLRNTGQRIPESLGPLGADAMTVPYSTATCTLGDPST